MHLRLLQVHCLFIRHGPIHNHIYAFKTITSTLFIYTTRTNLLSHLQSRHNVIKSSPHRHHTRQQPPTDNYNHQQATTNVTQMSHRIPRKLYVLLGKHENDLVGRTSCAGLCKTDEQPTEGSQKKVRDDLNIHSSVTCLCG